MIIDNLSGLDPTDVEADLCVIGAGAAGLAIARSFLGTSLRVCVVESGGLSGEHASQSLYEGDSVGEVPFDAASSRMRVFGGSCNLWGGGCIPFGRHDLGQRDWVPESGWPIGFEELQPWYERARAFCQIGDQELADGSFRSEVPRTPLPLDESKLTNHIFARSPILFGSAYRGEIERATNILILLHTNLIELDADASGQRILRARIGTLDGKRGSIRARHYVLACGGIENARLMLLSNSVIPEGLGNAHDLVGRYFMDHPSGRLGTVHTDQPHRLTRPYDRDLGKGSAPAFPEIGLSTHVQSERQMLNGRVHPFAVEGPIPNGIRALREFRAALRAAPKPDEGTLLEAQLCAAMRNGPSASDATVMTSDNLGTLMLRVGLGMGDIARAVMHKLTDKPTVRSSHVELVGYFEQAPNRHSRVTLGDELDAMGQRKVRVDWQLTPLDRYTYRHAAMLFGEELAQACNGRFEPEAWVVDGSTPQVHGTAHHLGTTRMSDDPTTGVVDRHCRVHGMDNLHIAGSSVFPTGGWAFPTFTIVALSMRLAEHLRGLLTDAASTGML
ncbi:MULTISPECIES: GMC oxidoreductase [Dyella]|uniref:GMC family oxidoreductase n=2 Tax=Dyella TaxID=231454 RepID=A0A4V2NKV2_9GAMM|nr:MULTISPECIES: GMC oxidoreductase [Dyella]TBR36189.1 GMC family oxidoreductase [Dyella terrae]TCI06238.1 GMC family oxidoreductase [Dyella soli]